MKRLFYIVIILFSGNLYADTVTTGSIGLLKPTTGVIDTKRNSGDKLNSNFDMIAATITTILNELVTLENSTATFASNVAASTNSIFTGGVTTYAPAYATSLSTVNILLNPSNTNYAIRSDVVISTNLIFTGGATTYAPAYATSLSTANSLLNPSNTNYAIRTNVSNSTNALSLTYSNTNYAVRADVVTSTMLLNSGSTVYANFENVRLSTNALGFTPNNTNYAIRSDVASATGSITGGSVLNSLRPVSIVIGTSNVQNVDYAGTSETPFNNAISSLTNGQGGGNIYVRAGTYVITAGVTIQSNINIICEGSVTIRTSGTNQCFIIQPNASIQGAYFKTPSAYDGRFIEMQSSSTFRFNRIDADMLNDSNKSRFVLANGYNIKIEDLKFDRLRFSGGVNNIVLFDIRSSSIVYFRRNSTIEPTAVVNTNDIMVRTDGSRNVYIENNDFINRNISVDIAGGNLNVFVKNNNFVNDQATPQHLITIGDVIGDGINDYVSSSIVVMGNHFIWSTSISNVMLIQPAAGDSVGNVLISNNTLEGNASATFVNINAVATTPVNNYFIHGNMTRGVTTFLTNTNGLNIRRRDNVDANALVTDD